MIAKFDTLTTDVGSYCDTYATKLQSRTATTTSGMHLERGHNRSRNNAATAPRELHTKYQLAFVASRSATGSWPGGRRWTIPVRPAVTIALKTAPQKHKVTYYTRRRLVGHTAVFADNERVTSAPPNARHAIATSEVQPVTHFVSTGCCRERFSSRAADTLHMLRQRRWHCRHGLSSGSTASRSV